MAIIYEKEGDSTIVLYPREFIKGGLVDGLGSDWTEMKLGMFFSCVDAHDENTSGPTGGETVAVSDVSDLMSFGIKDSDVALPGESGSLFLGVSSGGIISKILSGVISNSSGVAFGVGYAGAALVGSSVIANGPMLFPDPEPISDYNGFYAISISIANRGAGTQSVTIKVARQATVTGTDYSKSNLVQFMNSASYGASVTFPWASAGVARVIPDSAFIRIPFFNFRMRINSLAAIKISA